MTMDYRAIVFDLDGTLLDSLADIASAVNDILISQGFEPHPLERYRDFIGSGVRVLLERALPQGVQSADMIERCAAEFHHTYNQRWNQQTRPYEGIAELLQTATARGLQLAVLSNKPDEFTRKCVDFYFGLHQFVDVRGARSGVPCKPDPTAARAIAKKLACAPQHCLYLGDSGIDMQTAVGADMFPVGALWGFRPGSELIDCGARALVHHPCEVIELLG